MANTVVHLKDDKKPLAGNPPLDMELLKKIQKQMGQEPPDAKKEDPKKQEPKIDMGEDPLIKEKTNNQFKPPEAKIPFHESVVNLYMGNKLNIRFVWAEGQKNVKSYIIQVSITDLFSPVLFTKTTSANKIDLVLPNTGRFYWRVKSIHGEEASPWSDVKIFTVEYSQ